MAGYPTLPLWTDAYLADTAHLGDAEHGVYLQLLMLAWRTPDCRLPNDPAWIARKMRRSVDNFDATCLPILEEFWSRDGKYWVQKRLREEYEYVKKRSGLQRAKAKSRWEKEKDVSRGNAIAGSTDTGNAALGTTMSGIACVGNAPTPTPTPTPTKKETPSTEGAKKERGSRLPDDWQPTPEQIEFATAEGITDVDREAAKFRDHWKQQSGAKGVKLDWRAAWRTWVRRAVDFAGGAGNGQAGSGREQPRSAVERNAEIAARRAQGGEQV